MAIVSDSQIEKAANKGRTKWLQRYLVENLALLEIDNADYQSWFDSLIKYMESRGLKKSTQQKDYLSDVRSSIKVLDPNHPALKVVDFDKAIWTEINNRNSDRIAKRETKFLDDPNAIVKRATTLLNSYVWSEIAAGLAVLTGRRHTEVIKTAKFTYKTEYSVVFSGALKRRGEIVECIFEIPTLCKAQLAIAAIASLREKLGEQINTLSKRQVASRFSAMVSKQCDRYFSDLVPPRKDGDDLYTHLFKAVYGTIASFWYCPITVPEMEFRAEIQGHYQILDEQNPELRRSLIAGRNYLDYKISDGKGNIDGRLGIKLGLPSVKTIEKFEHHHQKSFASRSITTQISLEHTQKNSDFNEVLDRDPIKAKSDEPKSNSVTREKTKSLTSNRQITLMNQTKPNTDFTIPKFLHSRLKGISNQLEATPSETIEELIKWTEIGLALAEELNVDKPDPNKVFNSVRILKQQKVGFNSPQHHISNRTDSGELLAAKEQITSLTKSLEHLSSILSSSLPNTSIDVRKEKRLNTDLIDSEVKKYKLDEGNRKRQESLSLSKLEGRERQNADNNLTKVVRRDSSATVKEDVNHAIDAVMAFNDTEGRLYNHKFYIGIGSIRDLSHRGDTAIRKVLQERKEEIEEHLVAHELDQNHNLSRRDEKGDEYPVIDREPEIDYQKVTKVNYDN